ncbi:helix-turn-helix domain-containing protein [Haematobacter massiliensis]|uniref:helix-turn-helix domain-containing protein n=1 Tax=Haematobacter massiliensis TaxID=195105 RepID=UPI0023F16EFE|nr:helix-turn-helix domain-containing protein [Haematobacter massiliensis]
MTVARAGAPAVSATSGDPGAVIGNWDRVRWVWLERVRTDDTLSRTALHLAMVLVQVFANRRTARCNPGRATLAAELRVSERTVQRATVELEAAGWIERIGGGNRGGSVAFGFRFPASGAGGKGGAVVSLSAVERETEVRGKGDKNDAPPTPPYKEEPRKETKGGEIRGFVSRPVCAVVAVTEPWQAEAWNLWLADRGYPDLATIGRPVAVAGKPAWAMPSSIPPAEDNPHGQRVAEHFARWLASTARV